MFDGLKCCSVQPVVVMDAQSSQNLWVIINVHMQYCQMMRPSPVTSLKAHAFSTDDISYHHFCKTTLYVHILEGQVQS